MIPFFLVYFEFMLSDYVLRLAGSIHGTKGILLLHFGLYKEISHWKKLLQVAQGLDEHLYCKSTIKANFTLANEILPFNLMLQNMIESNMVNLKKWVYQTIIDYFNSMYF